MKIAATKIDLFTRQPLSTLSKTTIAALLGTTLLWSLLSALVGNIVILIMAIIAVLTALLVVTGIRWASILASLFSGYLLYVLLLQESYPVYHLIHPKDALGNTTISFITFIVISLMLWCALVGCGAGMSATVQNYQRSVWQGKPQTPRWFSAALTSIIGVLVGAILIAALSQPAAATTSAKTTNGVPTIHMGISSFTQSSVTVTKGSKLLLVDDDNFEHNIANGTWANGQPQPENQAGAPVVNHVAINGAGKSIEIGPFNTAGTYHLYCVIHSGMILTITVQ